MLKKISIIVTLISMVLVLSLAACKAPTVGETAAPSEAAEETKAELSGKGVKIGYVCNYMSHQWYQNIIAGMKAEAEKLGVESLDVADSNLDQNVNISAAENYITTGVSVLVITPVDPKAIGTVIEKAKAANIPVVTEGFVVEGAATYVGIEDYWSGYYAGKASGEYVKANFKGPAKILLIGLPFEIACRARIDGFKDGIKDSGAEFEIVQEVDGGGIIDQALTVATDALTSHPEVNLVFGINDDSAWGAIEAAKAVGINIEPPNFVVSATGLEGPPAIKALKDPKNPYKLPVAMFPQMVGVGLVDAAVALANGETVPAIQYTPTVYVSPEEIDKYYSIEGETAILNFDAAKALPVPERAKWWDENE
ncbi:MAG: sugar ABC transporter substrate-binding protein [Actinobacteria bacterium]|nr:sugar ABC transporter substrate-binding protein [Actinomycetota bacterium]